MVSLTGGANMHNTSKVALLMAGLALTAVPLLSQTPTKPKASFDVVSIKPTGPGNQSRGGGPRGDRFTMTGATLKMLLQAGYQRLPPGMIGDFEIIGGPSWIDSDQYNVEAKADCSGGPITREQYQQMIQSLIEDRFQVKAHLEPREVAVYELVLGKDGLKIKPTEDQSGVNNSRATPPVLCPPPPQVPAEPPAPRTTPFDPTKMRGFLSMQYSATSATATGNAVQLRMLLTLLRLDSGRPVIDKTNHNELYDFKLQFRTDRMPNPSSNARTLATDPNSPPAPADPVPTLANALQQQLGLKLEPGKAQVEVLVVESAQKPTEN